MGVTPPGAVRGWRCTPHNATRALLAVVAGARTIREVAATLDVSFSTAHATLRGLRREGLVGFVEERKGTLHANVRQIPLSPPVRH